jgi:hypothetical protein
MLFGTQGENTKSSKLVTQELWLAELLNCQVVLATNIDKTWDHQCQPKSLCQWFAIPNVGCKNKSYIFIWLF